MGKRELRGELMRARARMSDEARGEIDRAIAENLMHAPEYLQAKAVFTYLSVGAETDTRLLVEHCISEGKTVALPRCIEGTRLMTWHVLESSRELERLIRGPFGIEEPTFDPATLIDPATASPKTALAVVPGLAFDEGGLRLGYGGGFFDTFLASFEGTSAGLCRDAFLFESLGALGAAEPHDKPVRLVVTQSRIVRPAQSA